MLKLFITAAFITLATGSASAATIVSVEAAGVQSTTKTLLSGGTETFNKFGTGYKASLNSGFGGGGYTGTYGGDSFVIGANEYGGAGGIGNYYSNNGTTTLSLNASANYFGLWASALDGGNSVAFYKGGNLVDTVSLAGFPLDNSYLGNPNSGADAGEKFAFFNFTVGGGYDQVNFIQNGGGGFESDNHTVGMIAAVPESATWAMMIGGFGVIGGTMRRRRSSSLTALRLA